MKKTIGMLAILVMIGALYAGCKKAADQPNPETTIQSQESNTQDWEPETSDPTPHDPHDGQDHSGHTH